MARSARDFRSGVNIRAMVANALIALKTDKYISKTAAFRKYLCFNSFI